MKTNFNKFYIKADVVRIYYWKLKTCEVLMVQIAA